MTLSVLEDHIPDASLLTVQFLAWHVVQSLCICRAFCFAFIYRTIYRNSKCFEVKVGKHQDSALSPL